MGADFMGTKHVPVHTGDQEAAQKENQFFFFLLTQGLQEGFYKAKGRSQEDQGRRQVQGRLYFPEALQGAQE